MEQTELFGESELLPVREYLHVWNDAERARRLKEKTPDRPPGKSRVGKVMLRFPGLGRTRQGEGRSELPRLQLPPELPVQQVRDPIGKSPEKSR